MIQALLAMEDEGRGYRERARALSAENPRWGAKRIAATLLAETSDNDLRRLASLYVTEQVEHVLRERARRIEERAAAVRREAEERERAKAAEPGGEKHPSFAWSKAGRKACSACGCDKCQAALADYWKQEQEFEQRKANALGRIIDQFANEIRLEVTEELLGSDFALGDGTRVTWREATEAQHRQRIEMLRGNALANIEAASRHEAAISLLHRNGVSTLGQLRVVEDGAA